MNAVLKDIKSNTEIKNILEHFFPSVLLSTSLSKSTSTK